ncbi:MAG: type III polyketide synthase [wastewater metagenome]|nr:type III polyketide synthase [Candidatus Loosdrechtia aerotolerans]
MRTASERISDFSEGDVYVASTAVTTPPYSITQAQAKEFLIRHYSDKLNPKSLAIMHKVFSHQSIVRRYLAVDNLDCLVDEHPDHRIARFTNWALDLSSEAVLKALAQVGLTVDAISGLVVNTCTGYICPGISTYLIERLGLSCRTEAHDLVGSGCGGAVPNVRVCKRMVQRALNSVVVSVSVEICSATFQMDDDLSLIISNAVFADGASATLLWQRPEGIALVDSASRYNTQCRDDIRYIYKNGQLHNQISVIIPGIASRIVADVVMDLLKPRGLRIEDIKHWIFHPGGAKVINAIRDEIGLSETCLQATRAVLAQYGNMSSPTVWFVLREMLNNGIIIPGDWCMMVSFGAGLCAHAFLLRA